MPQVKASRAEILAKLQMSQQFPHFKIQKVILDISEAGKKVPAKISTKK